MRYIKLIPVLLGVLVAGCVSHDRWVEEECLRVQLGLQTFSEARTKAHEKLRSLESRKNRRAAEENKLRAVKKRADEVIDDLALRWDRYGCSYILY